MPKRPRSKTLFIFDEPTTGLHFDDINKLLAAFRALIDNGGSLVVIEHNLDVIKTADWVIDLGPEGGVGGGEIVATGTPEKIAKNAKSHTGRYIVRFWDSRLLAGLFNNSVSIHGLSRGLTIGPSSIIPELRPPDRGDLVHYLAVAIAAVVV